MYSITINKSYTDLLKKIRLHLSVIGKRAVNVQGESFYVELTTSSKEDKVFYDLIDAAGETLVSELSDVSSTYSSEDNITFVVRNDRWEKADETFKGNLKKALEQSIERYFVNFSLAQFLSAIFPALKETAAPLFGKPYIDHCQVIIKNIKTLAYLKRPDASSGVNYSEMLNANSDYWDDGKIISLLTIKRNGESVMAYNGTEDKVADIEVPVKVSELENDRGFINHITDEMVIDVLGYTPFDNAAFTKQNILSLSGIYPWALASAKPSYSMSEISGIADALALKYDKANFAADFRTEIAKYNLGHKVASSGTGSYVTGLYESADKKTIYYQLANLETAVKSIVGGMGDSLGTQVAWGNETNTSAYLNVGGTSKNLQKAGDYLLADYLKKLLVPVDSDGAELAWDANNIYAIKAKYNLFSVGALTAYGMGKDAEGDTTSVAWSQLVSSGTPIATITINGTSTTVYAPSGGASSWSSLTGRPTWLDNYISRKPTLKDFTNDGVYLTSSDIETYSFATQKWVNQNFNNYSHPTQTAISKSSTILRGIEVNSLGHVTGVTASALTKTELTTLISDYYALKSHTHSQYLTSSSISDMLTKTLAASTYLGITAKAADSDKLDSYDESDFFRSERGEIDENYIKSTNYNKGNSDWKRLNSGTYYCYRKDAQGAVMDSNLLIHFKGTGSTSALELYTNYVTSKDEPIMYRKHIDSDSEEWRRFSGGWVTLIDSLNIGKQTVNAANSVVDYNDSNHQISIGYRGDSVTSCSFFAVYTEDGNHIKDLAKDKFCLYNDNIGIGTADPQFKLHVEGSISAEGTNSVLPSHYYHYLYDDTGNVYEHFYPGNCTRKTYANLRVWNGSGFNTFKFGGDGECSWDGNKIKIGNAVLTYDSTNHLLTLSDNSGAALNLVTTGGMTAYGLASDAEIGTLVNLNVSNKMKAMLVETTSLLMPSGGCIDLKEEGAYFDCNLYVGDDDSEHQVSDIHADGTSVYMTINGTQYKLSVISRTTA